MTDEPASTPKHCAGSTVTGEPCGQSILVDGVYCVAHATGAEIVELRDAARRAGGHARSNRSVLMAHLKSDPTRGQLVDFLERAMYETHDGTLAPARANSIASLSRSILAAVTSAEESQRLSQLETTVETILSTLEKRGRRTG